MIFAFYLYTTAPGDVQNRDNLSSLDNGEHSSSRAGHKNTANPTTISNKVDIKPASDMTGNRPSPREYITNSRESEGGAGVGANVAIYGKKSASRDSSGIDIISGSPGKADVSEVDSFSHGTNAAGGNSDLKRPASRHITGPSSLTLSSVKAVGNSVNVPSLVLSNVQTPTALPSISNNGFAEANKMYDVCGLRFDRNQFTGAGDSVANLGDQHLSKLEEVSSFQCMQIKVYI